MAQNAPAGVRRERAQSELLGLVLLVGLTIAGVTFVVAVGSAALDDSRQASQLGSAEHAMTQLDSQISLVALGASERQRVTIARSDTNTRLYVDGSSGWMNVTIVNESTGAPEDVIMNASLGAVVYDDGDTAVAYQGGGVWRLDPSGGSVMVSPPEFHYRTTGGADPTLTLPLVVVEGDRSLNDRLIVEKNATDGKYPLAGNPSRSNPLDEGEINVTVQSDYYEAWGTFFEERTGGNVSYDHPSKQVTITLVIPSTTPTVGGAIITGASAGSLTIQNQAEVDSYNSSVGPYSTSSGTDTKIIAGGDIELQNQAKVWGNLEAGGSVTLDNKANVTGNVSYGGTLNQDPNANIGGWAAHNATVDSLDPVDWLIVDKRTSYSSSNDNSANPDVDDATDTLQGSSPWELDARGGNGKGEYYLDELTLQSDNELILNTTDGDVEVVVVNDITVQGDAKIRVVGPGRAKFYIEGDTAVQNQGNVSVPGDRSAGLWLYANPGASVEIINQARFVGVVYGPGSGAQPGVDIQTGNQAEIFGGLVGSVPSVQNGIGLHFDEALANEDPLAGTTGSSPTVTYLHVTVNSVDVTS